MIDVLISRRNLSLTVEHVEEEVRRSIADMAIEDDVLALVRRAADQLPIAQQVAGEITSQFQTLGLDDRVRAIVATYLAGQSSSSSSASGVDGSSSAA